MIYENGPARKAKLLRTKINAELKAKRRAAKAALNNVKRQKGNDGDVTLQQDDSRVDQTQSNGEPAPQKEISVTVGKTCKRPRTEPTQLPSKPSAKAEQNNLDFANVMMDDEDHIVSEDFQMLLQDSLNAANASPAFCAISMEQGPLTPAQRILAERASEVPDLRERFWQDKIMEALVVHYGNYQEVIRVLNDATVEMRDLEDKVWQRLVELRISDTAFDLPKGFLSPGDRDQYLARQNNIDNARYQYKDYVNACQTTGVDPKNPRYQLQPGNFTFKFWQPIAIHMMQEAEDRGNSGVILADGMGLGKTSAYLGFFMKVRLRTFKSHHR